MATASEFPPLYTPHPSISYLQRNSPLERNNTLTHPAKLQALFNGVLTNIEHSTQNKSLKSTKTQALQLLNDIDKLNRPETEVEEAIKFGATSLRIGSLFFGPRSF